ncbi:hypothetical protein Scep_016149 [Stephania cephalantha]|uniref:Uncharacterized protein n=1 Tax=Stephania cephalantha TaxID=152367 RepID=A0AAP0IM27_9MAGN
MISSTITPILTYIRQFTPIHIHRHRHSQFQRTNPNRCSLHCRRVRVIVRGSSSDANANGGAIDAAKSSRPDVKALENGSSSSEEGYVALFVRMLGLDYDPPDREQAIIALWKYAQGGKHCIDKIMQFHGCINLTVNLLQSDSTKACEAAAGFLRTVSSINQYRALVAESGAVEEITALLSKSSLTTEVKEQSLCTLWNLSVDEKLRTKVASADILPLLFKFLDDEEIRVKEAAGGILANFALSKLNHQIMVEEGVIPKLAKFLRSDVEGSKVIRKEAKNALLEFSKDEFYRILIVEEGLVLVPMVGADAYKSFKPVSHSWPSLPDGTEIERSSSAPSRYGASELLLGLNVRDKNFNFEEAKINAVVGRTQQQFLARIGAIELDDGTKPPSEPSTSQHYTLLPYVDGVARLVLILGLEDISAISRAAHSIADASINEHMRMSFMVAGAVSHLVKLLSHNDSNVRLAACHALERLSLSHNVCEVIEAEGAIYPLLNMLKNSEASESATEKTMNILARMLDPGKEMKAKFYDGPVNGSTKAMSGIAGNSNNKKISKAAPREDVLGSAAILRLIEILKTSSPTVQQKAASILEYAAIMKPCMEIIVAAGIESALDTVFHQRSLNVNLGDDSDNLQPELTVAEVEEAGLVLSAASRLLTKLLESEQFRQSINTSRFKQLLRQILKSDIPLHSKDWVAACLVKLESSSSSNLDPENPIHLEIAVHDTIPRLIEQIRTSHSPEAQEAAVVELNTIVSRGGYDYTRAVASQGGIFPLVKVIDEGTRRAAEASLVILFNLSMDDENHSAIISAGAIPVLRRVVLSEGPQWTIALHLLRTLPT